MAFSSHGSDTIQDGFSFLHRGRSLTCAAPPSYKGCHLRNCKQRPRMSDSLFPAKGLTAKDVIEKMQDMGGQDADWRGGRTWSGLSRRGRDIGPVEARLHHVFFGKRAQPHGLSQPATLRGRSGVHDRRHAERRSRFRTRSSAGQGPSADMGFPGHGGFGRGRRVLRDLPRGGHGRAGGRIGFHPSFRQQKSPEQVREHAAVRGVRRPGFGLEVPFRPG